MKQRLCTLSCILLAFLAWQPLIGQDIHYSQFHNAPFVMSPGLTGVFKEDVRLMANYRNQWRSVADYKTFTAAADMKIWPNRPRNGFFSAGLHLNRDQAGLSKLTLVNLGLNGSYTHQLTDHAFLTLGLQGAFNQRTFDLGGLSFDQQYDAGKGVYDPSLANGETAFDQSNVFFSLGAGVNFHLQKFNSKELVDELKERSKLDLGLGFSNLNRPDQSFQDSEKARLPVRATPYLLSVVQLGKDSDWDLAINATAQFQQKYREALLMGGLKYHINRQPGKQVALQLGAAYRFFEIGDAIAPVLEFNYNNWQVGVSWDINISEFNVATNNNGGPEISIRHAISRVKLPPFRICRLM